MMPDTAASTRRCSRTHLASPLASRPAFGERLSERGDGRSPPAQALAAIAERLRPLAASLAPDEFDALVEAVFLEGARVGAAWAEA
jgi:hypothetical protein